MVELRALALMVDGHRGGSALLNLKVGLGAAEPITELGAAELVVELGAAEWRSSWWSYGKRSPCWTSRLEAEELMVEAKMA